MTEIYITVHRTELNWVYDPAQCVMLAYPPPALSHPSHTHPSFKHPLCVCVYCHLFWKIILDLFNLNPCTELSLVFLFLIFFPFFSQSASELLKDRAFFICFVCLSLNLMLASLKFIFYTVCVTGVYWWEKRKKTFWFLKLIIIK